MREVKSKSGKDAEDFVAQYLRSFGNQILARNYFTRYGEIDIIYIEKSSGELVFGEVKYRENIMHGYPYEYVTKAKIRKIESCAEHFLAFYSGDLPEIMRIDVFSLTGDGGFEHFLNITG